MLTVPVVWVPHICPVQATVASPKEALWRSYQPRYRAPQQRTARGMDVTALNEASQLLWPRQKYGLKG
jgi:hypothetical protein